MKEVRTNRLFLVSYCSEDFISSVLDRKIQQIQAFAYILHDKDVYLKDVYKDGELLHAKGEMEIPHYHIYLELYNSRVPSEVLSWFKYEEDGKRINTLREYPYSCQSCIDYLTHKNARDKFQYDVNDIVQYGLKVADDGSLSPNLSYDNSLDILDNVLANVPLRELVKRYGKEFIYHYGQYRALAEDIKFIDRKNKIDQVNAINEVLEPINENNNIFEV